MAIAVNTEALPEKSKGSGNAETKHIPAGLRPARVVSYIELGRHKQIFRGKPAVYESGKNKGKEKPVVFHVKLTFEFPLCEYTGDYPLTISTTRRMENGEFFDAVTVPESLMTSPPTLSRTHAMRTKFVRYLSALQAATETAFQSIADYSKAQCPVVINVTNKEIVKDGEKKVFANMRPEGIQSCKVEDPLTGRVNDIKASIPGAIGEYCAVYDWDRPTEDAWNALKPWDQDTIKAAVDFPGSPTDLMLQANPELDAVTSGKADGNPAADNSAPEEPSTPATPPLSAYDDIPV